MKWPVALAILVARALAKEECSDFFVLSCGKSRIDIFEKHRLDTMEDCLTQSKAHEMSPELQGTLERLMRKKPHFWPIAVEKKAKELKKGTVAPEATKSELRSRCRKMESCMADYLHRSFDLGSAVPTEANRTLSDQEIMLVVTYKMKNGLCVKRSPERVDLIDALRVHVYRGGGITNSVGSIEQTNQMSTSRSMSVGGKTIGYDPAFNAEGDSDAYFDNIRKTSTTLYRAEQAARSRSVFEHPFAGREQSGNPQGKPLFPGTSPGSYLTGERVSPTNREPKQRGTFCKIRGGAEENSEAIDSKGIRQSTIPVEVEDFKKVERERQVAGLHPNESALVEEEECAKVTLRQVDDPKLPDEPAQGVVKKKKKTKAKNGDKEKKGKKKKKANDGAENPSQRDTVSREMPTAEDFSRLGARITIFDPDTNSSWDTASSRSESQTRRVEEAAVLHGRRPEAILPDTLRRTSVQDSLTAPIFPAPVEVERREQFPSRAEMHYLSREPIPAPVEIHSLEPLSAPSAVTSSSVTRRPPKEGGASRRPYSVVGTERRNAFADADRRQAFDAPSGGEMPTAEDFSRIGARITIFDPDTNSSWDTASSRSESQTRRVEEAAVLHGRRATVVLPDTSRRTSVQDSLTAPIFPAPVEVESREPIPAPVEIHSLEPLSAPSAVTSSSVTRRPPKEGGASRRPYSVVGTERRNAFADADRRQAFDAPSGGEARRRDSWVRPAPFISEQSKQFVENIKSSSAFDSNERLRRLNVAGGKTSSTMVLKDPHSARRRYSVPTVIPEAMPSSSRRRGSLLPLKEKPTSEDEEESVQAPAASFHDKMRLFEKLSESPSDS